MEQTVTTPTIPGSGTSDEAITLLRDLAIVFRLKACSLVRSDGAINTERRSNLNDPAFHNAIEFLLSVGALHPVQDADILA